MGALRVTVPACPQPLGQPRGSPSFGPALRRWQLQGLGQYLCAGPCGPGLWGPRAPGTPIPLGLTARRRRRQEQLLQLQREGARKGVGIAVRAGEKAQEPQPLGSCVSTSIIQHSTQKWGKKSIGQGGLGLGFPSSSWLWGRCLAVCSPVGVGAVPTFSPGTSRQVGAVRTGGNFLPRDNSTGVRHTGAAVASQLLTPPILP